MAYTNALISPQNFQQLKSCSWTCAYTKGRDLPRKAFWISKPISSPLTPNSIYMPHPPTLPEQAGVSSRENYSDTSERTQTKLRSRYTEKHVENMKKRGYRQEIIDRSIRGIKFPDRQKTLTKKKHDASERLTFTTTYSPHLPTYRLRRLLTKHWHLIEKSPLLSRLFLNRPTVAFRTHKSIRKQLTRARLEDTNITHKIHRELNLLCEPLPAPNAPPLIRKCNNNCLTCKALDTKPYIKSTSKGTHH